MPSLAPFPSPKICGLQDFVWKMWYNLVVFSFKFNLQPSPIYCSTVLKFSRELSYWCTSTTRYLYDIVQHVARHRRLRRNFFGLCSEHDTVESVNVVCILTNVGGSMNTHRFSTHRSHVWLEENNCKFETIVSDATSLRCVILQHLGTRSIWLGWRDYGTVPVTAVMSVLAFEEMFPANAHRILP